jgi:hypothetical protein
MAKMSRDALPVRFRKYDIGNACIKVFCSYFAVSYVASGHKLYHKMLGLNPGLLQHRFFKQSEALSAG